MLINLQTTLYNEQKTNCTYKTKKAAMTLDGNQKCWGISFYESQIFHLATKIQLQVTGNWNSPHILNITFSAAIYKTKLCKCVLVNKLHSAHNQNMEVSFRKQLISQVLRTAILTTIKVSYFLNSYIYYILHSYNL